MSEKHVYVMTDFEVVALLEQRKTRLRRPMEPQPQVTSGVLAPSVTAKDGKFLFAGIDQLVEPPFPRGQILWIREPHWAHPDQKGADGKLVRRFRGASHQVMYEFFDGAFDRIEGSFTPRELREDGWQWYPPPSHPREAARFFVTLVDVKAERVGPAAPLLSAADILAEGFLAEDRSLYSEERGPTKSVNQLRMDYQLYWDGLFAKKGAVFLWSQSPWTWVYTFRIRPDLCPPPF